MDFSIKEGGCTRQRGGSERGFDRTRKKSVEDGCEVLCEIEVEGAYSVRNEEATCEEQDGGSAAVPRSVSEEALSAKFQSDIWPVNVSEQRDNFFTKGLTPEFKLKGSPYGIEQIVNHQNGQIKFNYFFEAKRILDFTLRKYKSLDKFILHAFGNPISIDESKEKVTEYLKHNNVDDKIHVIWSRNLICSAQMCSSRPKAVTYERDYTLLIKNCEDNNFIREHGIYCLLNHEIGTHYVRSYNDSLQIFAKNRQKYNVTSIKCHEGMKTEEGLACIHTIVHSRVKYLSMPALLYYGSCMAMYLSFKQLFEHLARYVKNPEQRWKHCMRIKRILKVTSTVGGYGKDQRYFEGAVEILRNIDRIDFKALICAKIIWTDIPKIVKLMKYDNVKIPSFMSNYEEYIRTLKDIALLNGLTSKPEVKFIPRSRRETLHYLGLTDEQVCKVSRPFKNSGNGDSEINVAKLCGCTLYSGIKHDIHFEVNDNNKRPLKKRQIPIIFELEFKKPIIP